MERLEGVLRPLPPLRVRAVRATTAGPEQFGFTSIVYVHPDARRAEADMEPHIRYFRERCFALPLPIFFPPGLHRGPTATAAGWRSAGIWPPVAGRR